MNTKQITVQADVSADPGRAWECYTKPEHIVHWNFASNDWHCPKATNDLRVGGKYSARMEARDGSFGFDFEAVYDTVRAQNGFTYTMGDGRKAAVDFEKMPNGTRVTVRFDPETENSLEMQQSGWQAILDNFKKYAEAV